MIFVILLVYGTIFSKSGILILYFKNRTYTWEEITLKDNKFSNVLNNFKKICSIPRCSGNEKGISGFLTDFARNLGFEAFQDEVLNVVIRKPACPGYENAPTVILQGHMDMVGVSERKDGFNFDTDPIEVYEEEGYLKAKDTTLGADNGIALAYMLTLLELKDARHPELEMLMTVSEETGMNGAFGLKPGILKGKILINLDSEEEGILMASCAGGVTSTVSLPVAWEKAGPGQNPYLVRIHGLKGGHSGLEIDKQRANAIVLLARFLDTLSEAVEFRIVSVEGGTRQNAISNEAKAIVYVKDENRFKETIMAWESIIKNEYRDTDPDISIAAEPASDAKDRCFSPETLRNLIDLILLVPNGIQSTSVKIPGLVVSSNNPGILRTGEASVELVNCVRSSVGSLKKKMTSQIEIAARRTGGKAVCTNDYPEWPFSSDSKIRELCVKVYEQMYGRKPVVDAVHAGLECGIFKETIGQDIDMISFGPDIQGAHTVNERMNIASAERVWDYLLKVLEEVRSLD